MKLDCIVIQFAKFPRLGGVKTRLKPLLGDDGCYQIHQQLVRRVNENLSESDFFNVLAVDQLGDQALINELAKSNSLLLQEGKDLGERMKNAMHWGLKRAEKVIVVGSDCPLINQSHLKIVNEKLNTNSHVFIPAEDGGYVLIACTKVVSDIYQGVSWGTEKVMQQTREKLALAEQETHYCESLWDVDRPEDYQRLMEFFPHWPSEK